MLKVIKLGQYKIINPIKTTLMNNAIKNQTLTRTQRVMILLCVPAILLLSNCAPRSKVNTTILDRKPTREQLKKMVERLNESEINEENVRIQVDVKKVDCLWKDPKFRLSREYNKIENKEKYIQSRIDLWEEKVKNPPMIFLYDENKQVGFSNGRHRFANLRDMGAAYIYVDIDKDSTTDDIVYFE